MHFPSFVIWYCTMGAVASYALITPNSALHLKGGTSNFVAVTPMRKVAPMKSVHKIRAVSSGQSTQTDRAKDHWRLFISLPHGVYHGRFCRYDAFTGEVLIETHLSRSYTITQNASTSPPFLRQMNTIYFDDERGTVVRGPWDITEACNTPRGIVHPRVDTDDTTFVYTPSGRASAWVQHRVAQDDPNNRQGTMQGLKVGHEGAGFMADMIIQHGDHLRINMAAVYDTAGALQHITLNREDLRGWPSPYWTAQTRATPIAAADVDAALGLTAAGPPLVGRGEEVWGDLRNAPVPEVPWARHAWALAPPAAGSDAAPPVVLRMPDGIVIACPAQIPFGRPWGVCALWRTGLGDGGGGPGGGGAAAAVRSVESRYSATGFDSFRSLVFDNLNPSQSA